MIFVAYYILMHIYMFMDAHIYIIYSILSSLLFVADLSVFIEFELLCGYSFRGKLFVACCGGWWARQS
jgi:hypothetical protein